MLDRKVFVKNCFKIAGGTMLALASLFFVAEDVQAQTVGSIAQVATSTFRFTVPTGGSLSGQVNTEVAFDIYSSPYPATTTAVGGAGTGGAYPFPLYFIITANFVSCTSNNTTYFQCELESIIPTDGVYWFRLYSPNNDDGTIIYHWHSVTRSGGEWSIDIAPIGDDLSTTYQTRFTDAVVSGTASSTLVTAGYYLNTDEYNSANRPDTVLIQITDTSSNQIASVQKLILPLTTGYATTTRTITPLDYNNASTTALADGNYTAWIYFWNFGNGAFVFTRSSLVVNFTITSGVVSSSTIVDREDGLLIQDGFTERPCGITAIGGCIINALMYIFYPSTESIDSIMAVSETMSTKFPFAYAYDMSGTVSNLYSGSLTASSSVSYDFNGIGTLTLFSRQMLIDVPFSTTIRSMLGYLLWLIFMVVMYRRTLTIFDKKTV